MPFFYRVDSLSLLMSTLLTTFPPCLSVVCLYYYSYFLVQSYSVKVTVPIDCPLKTFSSTVINMHLLRRFLLMLR